MFYLLLLLGICAIPFALAQRSFDGRTTSATSPKQTQRTLTFVDRVAYQRAIEDVYWRHRIWPKENPKPKPSLDEVMSRRRLKRRSKIISATRKRWKITGRRPITPEQLQAEMERMARNTKQPEVLRELFEALGNDPFVIAECLARPVLAERLVADLSATTKPALCLATSRKPPSANSSITTLGTADLYLFQKFPILMRCTDNTWTATSTTNAPAARFRHTAVWTGSEMIVWGGI